MELVHDLEIETLVNALTRMNAPAPSPATLAGAQIREEFPWLPDSLHEALDHLAEGKVVVPNLELDREFHALCLLSLPYLRINSIMFEHVGHGFSHRPACVVEPPDIIVEISVRPLSSEQNRDCENLFGPLLTEMERLEGHDSMVNKRRVAPGVYTQDEYRAASRGEPIMLQ